LRSPAGADLLRRCSLTYYALYQRGQTLDVLFRSDKPSIIAGFLRNRRMWPDFWEFEGPGDGSEPGVTPEVEWQRD
jgi:hypothetical protein